MWLANQETDSSRALGLTPGSWAEPGALNVHHSSLLLRHGVDAKVFYVIHPSFFSYISAYRFELNTRIEWFVLSVCPFVYLSICLSNDIKVDNLMALAVTFML